MYNFLMRLKNRLIRSSAKEDTNLGTRGNTLRDAHMDSPCGEI
jgi:hypothetical protein